MEKAESIIEEKIAKAFSDVKSLSHNLEYDSWRDIPDGWLEKNADLFLYYSNEDELFLLPAFLCYLLRNFRSSHQHTIYSHISGTLREYSKSKVAGCFKLSITNEQFFAIRAFIKHLRYNQPMNMDVEEWEKTLKDWVRSS